MSNLIDIQTQIEKLQKQAADIKSREFDKTVQEIRDKMQAFGITVKDLQRSKGRGSRRRAATKTIPGKKVARKTGKSGTATVVPKYKGPDGELWSGRGLTPRWLTALIEQGRSKDEFLIESH